MATNEQMLQLRTAIAAGNHEVWLGPAPLRAGSAIDAVYKANATQDAADRERVARIGFRGEVLECGVNQTQAHEIEQLLVSQLTERAVTKLMQIVANITGGRRSNPHDLGRDRAGEPVDPGDDTVRELVNARCIALTDAHGSLRLRVPRVTSRGFATNRHYHSAR